MRSIVLNSRVSNKNLNKNYPAKKSQLTSKYRVLVTRNHTELSHQHTLGLPWSQDLIPKTPF